MKKFGAFLLSGCFVFSGLVQAQDENLRAGIDLAMPYSLLLGGNGSTGKGNLNVGIDGRYFTSDALSLGARFFFYVQDSNGPRQMGFAPGLQYHWMPKERWDPYFRLDLPFIFRGAANSTGSKTKMDSGMGLGLGLAWNVGDGIGVEDFIFRYDFALNLTYGIGDATSLLSLDLFRIGVDYRF